MTEKIEITIRNRLIKEKRDLNVYHHSTRSAYIISHGNSAAISLEIAKDGDYLHLSIVSGPGGMEKDCSIDIPSWCDFTISAPGNVSVTHTGERMWLTIPPGPPVWQLKITCSSSHENRPIEDYVIIGDDGYKP